MLIESTSNDSLDEKKAIVDDTSRRSYLIMYVIYTHI